MEEYAADPLPAIVSTLSAAPVAPRGLHHSGTAPPPLAPRCGFYVYECVGLFAKECVVLYMDVWLVMYGYVV